MRTIASVIALLALTACSTVMPEPGPAPPPVNAREVLYTCADGTQLTANFRGDSVAVAIIGGVSMVLPSAGSGYYSNGRYGLRGGGASAQWEVGRAAPVTCRGS